MRTAVSHRSATYADGTEFSDRRHHPFAAVANADAHWMFGIDAVSDEALADLARALRANSSSS